MASHSGRSPGRAERAALGAVLCLSGALGAWPGSHGPDPVAALAWLAVLAPAAGSLAATRGLSLLPLGWLVPVLWTLPVAWAGASSPRPLPGLAWAALAWTGLYAAGAGLGLVARARGWNPWATCGLVLLASGLLAVLPARGSIASAPWPVPAARALLDLAPPALVIECAGVDWMRHPAVYDPVQSDRFERRAWRGALAGPVALLVGCLLAALARLLPAREREPGRPGGP